MVTSITYSFNVGMKPTLVFKDPTGKYEDLTVVIEIGDTKITCITVNGKTCGTVRPFILFPSAFTIKAMLAPTGVANDICSHILGIGGCSKVSFDHYRAMKYKYIKADALIPPGFDPGFVAGFDDYRTAKYCFQRAHALVPPGIKKKCGW